MEQKLEFTVRGCRIVKANQTTYNCKTKQTRIEEVELEEIVEDLPIIQEPTLEERIVELENKSKEQDIEIALSQDVINFILFSPFEMSTKHNKELNKIGEYLAKQISKGNLDYELVMSRYTEFKEDIDTILATRV